MSGGIYSNDFFGFSIEVPSGWKVGDNELYKKLNERLREEVSARDPELGELGRGEEVDAPVLLMVEVKPWADGKHHRLVQILSTDLTNRAGPASAEGFLNFITDVNKRKGLSVEYISKPQSVDVGGRTLWKAYFTQRTTIEWHGVNMVIVEKGHVLQFILSSPDADGLQSLEVLFKTLRFTS